MDNQTSAVFCILTMIQTLCKEANVDDEIRTGPAATYSNTLIISILLLKNLFGFSSERSFLRYIRNHHSDIFTQIPEQSWFNRKAKKLVYVERNMHQLLLQKLGVQYIDLRIVDSTPVPVVKPWRAKNCNLFEKKTEAAFGYCASKDMYYYGQKLTLFVTPSGIPTNHIMTPANVHDVRALKEHLPLVFQDLRRKRLVGDKGYYDGELEVTLETRYKTRLVVPEKKRHRKKNTKEEKQLLRKRSIIETINNQLQDIMNIDETRARSIQGLHSRIQAAITSFTFGIYFNVTLGRPPLAIKSILA